MSHLILIKHAMPEVNPEEPASRWHLSEAGKRSAAGLAEEIAGYRPSVLLASIEPKARQTGTVIGKVLNLPCLGKPGLHEQRREAEPFLPDQAAFQERVRALFQQPDSLVFGSETATQATKRFERAVVDSLRPYPEATVALVAHGTVITLFVARHNPAVKPFELWSQLSLPSYVVLSRPDFRLEAVMAGV